VQEESNAADKMVVQDKRSIYYVRYPNLAIYYCLTMASGHYLPILYHTFILAPTYQTGQTGWTLATWLVVRAGWPITIGPHNCHIPPHLHAASMPALCPPPPLSSQVHRPKWTSFMCTICCSVSSSPSLIHQLTGQVSLLTKHPFTKTG